jgi:hypothetical protein
MMCERIEQRDPVSHLRRSQRNRPRQPSRIISTLSGNPFRQVKSCGPDNALADLPEDPPVRRVGGGNEGVKPECPQRQPIERFGVGGGVCIVDD